MRTTRILAFSTALAGLAAGVGYARAQSEQPAAGNGQLEEIVVTAQKRSEDLQKTPVAVTALSGDALKDGAVTRTSDLNGLVPAVQLGTGFAGTGALVAIRGVTTNSTKANADQSIAFSQDDVALPHPGNALSLLYDIDRVEALRGPQGTLYGRNATGGAINIITNKPVDQLDMAASVEVGNHADVKTDAMLNIPVDDKIIVRGAMEYVRHDPWFEDGQQDEDDVSGRIHALLRPTDDVDARVTASYTHLGGDGPGFWVNPPGAGTSGLGISPSGNPWQGFPACREAGGIPNRCIGTSFLDDDSMNLSGELNWHTPWALFTYLPAFSVYRDRSDLWGYTGLYLYAAPHDDERVMTHEVRASNPDGSAVKWVAGLFYYRDAIDDLLTVLSSPAALTAGGGTTDDPDDRAQSYAAYGQMTIPVPGVDALRFTGGLRYTIDRKSASVASYTSLPGGPPLPTAGGPPFPIVTTLPQYSKSNNVSYRIGLDYDLSPDSLLAATFSTGYKSGGFDNAYRGPGAVAPDTFPSEHIDAFEITSKNRFLENRLQVNLSAYYYDYSSFQVENIGLVQTGPQYPFGPFGPPIVPFVNTGIGFPVYPADITFFGGEIETKWKVTPDDQVELNLSLEHADQSKLTFYQLLAGPNGTAAPLDYAGYAPVKTPNVTFTLGLQHVFELADGSNLLLHGDTHFESPQWLNFAHYPGAHQPAYTMSSIDATYNLPDGRWYVAAFASNLENSAVRDTFYSAGFVAGKIPIVYPFSEASLQPPRLFGLRVGFHFAP